MYISHPRIVEKLFRMIFRPFNCPLETLPIRYIYLQGRLLGPERLPRDPPRTPQGPPKDPTGPSRRSQGPPKDPPLEGDPLKSLPRTSRTPSRNKLLCVQSCLRRSNILNKSQNPSLLLGRGSPTPRPPPIRMVFMCFGLPATQQKLEHPFIHSHEAGSTHRTKQS